MKIIPVLVFYITSISTTASAQHRQHKRQPKASEIFIPIYYTYAEQDAEPPLNVTAWVSDHLRYPFEARRWNLSGTTDVSFQIGKDGVVTAVAVAKSSGQRVLDSEACRVVRQMPNWKPAKSYGNPFVQHMVIPVRFTILPPARP